MPSHFQARFLKERKKTVPLSLDQAFANNPFYHSHPCTVPSKITHLYGTEFMQWGLNILQATVQLH